MSGRKPTHHVSVLHEPSGRWFKVGVGWQNDKGTISIRLDPFVDIGRMGPDDHMVVGVARDFREQKSKPDSKHLPETRQESLSLYDFDADGDDIPF